MAHETDFSFILPAMEGKDDPCFVMARLAPCPPEEFPIIFGWEFGTDEDCKKWLRDGGEPDLARIDLTRTEALKIINALLAAVTADRDREEK